MTKFAPTPGATVYSIHGQAARYVAKSGSGHIVEPEYNDPDDDEPCFDSNVATWREVFSKPPTEKLHEECKRLEGQLQAKRAELNAMRSERQAMDAEFKARMDRIKQHEQLAELDRYLAGELTHYVATHAYYPSVEVIPLGETLDDFGNASGYGLLHLQPRSTWDKKVQWTVTYKRPSPEYSRTTTVIPCCGEAAAIEKAGEVLRDYLAKYQAEAPLKWSYPEQLVGSCHKFGVEVPQWLLAGLETRKRSGLESSIAEHRKKLAEAEAALSAIARATKATEEHPGATPSLSGVK